MSSPPRVGGGGICFPVLREAFRPLSAVSRKAIYPYLVERFQ